MRYLALATDYDGTLATQGKLSSATVEALEKWKDSGRQVILITGRILSDLLRVCPRVDIFDGIIAENGAIFFRPGTQELLPLADPPPAQFVIEMKKAKVQPLEVGNVVVATCTPNETEVAEIIHALGLPLRMIFNKEAIMVLPSHVDKASGLDQALDMMHLNLSQVVGVGDAENDESFLKKCELSAAVGNAILSVKELCDVVLDEAEGSGVVQLIQKLLKEDP